jgi:hypothetical protein
MNQHDSKNLEFLLNVSKEVFDDWLSQCDSDDIDYALELLAMKKEEIYAERFDNIKDYTEANKILKAFTL